MSPTGSQRCVRLYAGWMLPSLAGKLLVATPGLLDPYFARTVVLLVEHDTGDGALGLVLNRRLPLDPTEQLAQWSALLDPAAVFYGGPVNPEMAVGLADTPGRPPEDWTAVVGNIGLVDLGDDPESIGGAVRVRVWAGYAGWTSGQLEAELETGSWFVVDAQPGDPFTDHPEAMWSQVLRRQGDRLSMYADYPIDPSLN